MRINENAQKIFTEQLYKYFCLQKLSLIESLEIMKERNCVNNEKVRKTSEYLYGELSAGNIFSSCLRKCSLINFDDNYVSFVYLAENTGNLFETLEFLKNRCERTYRTREKILETMIYPVFIVFMAVGVSILMWSYCTPLIKDAGCKGISLRNLFGAYGFLIAFCSFCLLMIKKITGGNKLYEAFLAIGFLIKANIRVTSAIGMGVFIVGEQSMAGRFLLKAKIQIEYGMDLYRAFLGEQNFKVLRRLRLQEASYLTKKTGGENDLFMQMAQVIARKDEMNQKLCASLIEPVFILGTGIFLLLMTVNFFMPVLNGFMVAL